MRLYKIQNSDLWYKIFRHPMWDESTKEYYSVRREWDKDAKYARIFFHKEDAESALVIIRRRWKTESTSSTHEENVEKQSWSEF